MHRELYSYFRQRMCIDHCIMSRERFQNIWVSYILTMQDSWALYLVAVPVASMDAETMAKAVFLHLVLRFGVCKPLHSDHWADFISEIFQSIIKSIGITKALLLLTFLKEIKWKGIMTHSRKFFNRISLGGFLM